MTIDLNKAKLELADTLLAGAMVAIGGVVGLCKQVDATNLGPVADAAFNTVRDLRAAIQARIGVYQLAA